MSKKELAEATELSFSDTRRASRVALLSPMEGIPGDEDCIWGIPALLWGEPGIAKSALVKQEARSLDLLVSSIFCGQHAPEDFSGAAMPDGEGGIKVECVLGPVREIIHNGEGVAFLDELNQAAPATQGAVQAMVHERRVGDQKLPHRTRIIGAANPEEIATGGYRLSPAMANRWLHLFTEGPSIEEWGAWFISSKRPDITPAEDLEELVIKNWNNYYPRVQGLMLGHLKANQKLKHSRPPISNPQSGLAWPSLRTWDLASRAYATAEILKVGDFIADVMVEAAVGRGAATSFAAFRKSADLPDPEDMLKKGWKPRTDRLDITMAAYSSMASFVVGVRDRTEQLELATLGWKRMQDLINNKLSDIVVPLCDAFISAKLGRRAMSENKKLWDECRKVLVPLGESGIGRFLEESI